MIKQVTGLLDEDVDKLGVQVDKIEGRVGIPGGGERAGHDGRDGRFFGICVHVNGGNLLDRGACGFPALCFDAFGFEARGFKARSEERRVGNEGGSRSKFRWSPYPYKKTKIQR